MLRTFRFRLFPNSMHRAALERILADNCETYNAALQERKEAWKLQRKSVTLYEQFKEWWCAKCALALLIGIGMVNGGSVFNYVKPSISSVEDGGALHAVRLPKHVPVSNRYFSPQFNLTTADLAEDTHQFCLFCKSWPTKSGFISSAEQLGKAVRRF